MRTLVMMRGAPGCGKSTWITQQGLSDYALSADVIRSLFASQELSPDGSVHISQKNDKIVWETLFTILERRMQRGEFTVIDACNSKTSEMKRYKDLADQYRYRMVCVDMTHIPIDEVLARNAGRPALKFVPEDYIRRVYSRFETQKIPSGIAAISPESFEDSVYVKPFDLSAYDRVVHIGDIHGCYDALQRLFGENPLDGVDPNTAYIFLGDYIDRGQDSAKVLRFLEAIAPMPNVCLIEGNHEGHLWAWATDKPDRSRDFGMRTRLELQSAGFTKEDARKLYRRFRQCSLYTWRGKTVLATHAGVPCLDAIPRIDFVPSFQMIKGVGAYEDMEACADSFERQSGIDYQVFGHRNCSGAEPQVRPHSIVLENAVERGGTLRVATLSEGGWSFADYTSDSAVLAKQATEREAEAIDAPGANVISSLVDQMRQSPLIIEKPFGHISSFNFTRSAFNDKRWDDLTVKARGLYIDTKNMKIAARGYEKFFNVGEHNTTIQELSKRFAFPIEVFRKENGFLGLLSFDQASGSLFATTKSSPEGDMATLFRSMISDELREAATEYLAENDVTLLFEAVHPEKDPHIIEYEAPQLFLLDVVSNELEFKAMPYDELEAIASSLGVTVKQRTAVITTWDEFMELYRSSQNTMAEGTDQIEGYVLRDANGYMVKLKTDYYNTWKYLRSIAEKLFKYGHVRYTSGLTTPMMNYFYAFARDYYAQSKEHRNIIELRNMFNKSVLVASETKNAS